MIFLLFFVVSFHSLIGEKLKLYTLYTRSHKILYDAWFLPSIKDDFEIRSHFYDDVVGQGAFRADDWFEAINYKIDLIIQAIKENKSKKEDKIFIFSDVDIQFFKPCENLIRTAMRSNDMVFQKDSPSGMVCTGFFACRANKKTLKFWRTARRLVKHSFPRRWHDQTAANFLINNTKFGKLQWDYFPATIFSGGTLTGKRWDPGKQLPIPEDIILHHANWTVGIENKIKQLEYVKNFVKKR